MENPDYNNPEFNTKFGVYSQGCVLEDVLMTWGHDEYMYLVAKENKTTLPQGGMFIIRYHSFYPLHKAGAYTQLMNEEDVENLKWLHILNINEFLKPVEGESYYGGRGRECGGRGFQGGYEGSSPINNVSAPKIEDPGQFPTLGAK